MPGSALPPLATPDGARVLAEALATLDSGVCLLDGRGRVVFWGPWLVRASGIAATAARGRTLPELFDAAVAEALLDAVTSALDLGMSSILSQQLHRRPLPLMRGRGSRAEPMEQTVLVRPLRPSGGAPSDAAPICLIQVSDVTTAVRRERHLRDQEAALRLRNRAVEASSQGIIIVDAQAEGLPILYANPAFTAITGWTAKDVEGLHPRFLHGEDRDQPGLEVIRAAIADQREGMAVVRNRRKDGTPFWNELLVAPVVDAKGGVTHFVGIQRDISARREVEAERDHALAQARAANERLLREKAFITTVLQTADALVVVLDRRGLIVSANRAAQRVTGLSEDSLTGTRLSDLIPDDKTTPRFRLDQGLIGGDALTTRLAVTGGKPRWVRWSITPLAEGDGSAHHLICTGIDVTERRRAESLLQAERHILELVARAESQDIILEELCHVIERQIDGSKAAVLLLDGARGTLSPAACPSLDDTVRAALAGVAVGAGAPCGGRAAFLGQPVYVSGHGDDFVACGGQDACWTVPVMISSGAVLGTVTTFPAEGREPEPHEKEVLERAARLVAIAVERQRAEERVRYLALYDPLTGLGNRTLLQDRLDSAITHARRHDMKVALLFIDLDGFKAINDTHGHGAGDEVLAAIGRRVAACVRDSDTAARIGGDEFVLLLSEIHSGADAETVAAKVLETVRRPVPWGGHDLIVGASIGIALHPDDAATADALLTQADNAMYAVKQAGKGAVRRAE